MLKLFDALFGSTHTARTFEMERFGNNTNGQNAGFLGGTCNDRGCTGTRTTAHTGGDEYHVAAFKLGLNVFDGFFGGGTTGIRSCACTKTLGNLAAKLHLARGFALGQGL